MTIHASHSLKMPLMSVKDGILQKEMSKPNFNRLMRGGWRFPLI